MLLWKKIYIFPRQICAFKVHTSNEINWLILSCTFRGGKKLWRDKGRLTFSSCSFAAQFRVCGHTARACAPMWACSQASVATGIPLKYTFTTNLLCLGRRWDFKYQWIVHCGINSWRGSQHLEVSKKSSCES